MRILQLLRHGEAEIRGFDDFDRPLTSNGIEQIKSVGEEIQHSNIFPELILYSPAVRTSETKKILAEFLPKNVIYKQEKSIYLASLSNLLALLYGVEDKYKNFMIIGHNPGLSELLRELNTKNQHILSTGELVNIAYN